jgi:hypothetical protein
MTAREFRLVWPVDELVNLNAERSMHRMARAKLVKPIRDATASLAAGHSEITGPVDIDARFQWADARVRDSSNWLPTVKAMVDGLVDAKVLARDDDRTVRHTGLGVDLPPQPGLKGYVQIVVSIRPARETV